jgi:uncharacterized protein involved in type VI secretion and phage assembly
MTASTYLIAVTMPTVKLGGSDLPATWYDALREVRVDLEYRVPGRGVLRFSDPGYGLTSSDKTALGTGVTIGARRPGQTSDDVLLAGEITGVGVEQGIRADPELVLVVHDKAQRLARGTMVQTYINSSFSDVVSKIAQRHGLTPSVSAPAGSLDYVLQVDSDLALLDAVADRTGCDWWVDDTTLHFKPPASNPRASTSLDLALGRNLHTFEVRASGLHADAVHVEGWDRKQQQSVTGTSQNSAASQKPTSQMFSGYVNPGPKLGGSVDLFSAGLSVRSAEEAQQVADSLRDHAVSAAVTATGTVMHGSQILPGVKVAIADAGPTSGTYNVTKVEHLFRTRFESRFVAGDRRPTSLVDTLAGRGGATTSPLRHDGLVVGQVTNINDDAKSGRVKVRYPGMATDEESAWARPLSLGGGANRGMVWLPEVGDEVLIGFEGGDLRQPVVLGGLFGDKSTIPLWDVAEGKVAGRRITSRLGHYVELKDGTTPSTQYIAMVLEGGSQKINFAKDKVEVILPSGVPFSIKAGDNASIAIDATGNLTIKAINITLEADGSLSTKSKAMTKLESTSALTVQGQMTSVKGSVVQVESTGPATIKGMPVAIN